MVDYAIRVINNHAEETLTAYREYVFTYKSSIKLPWGEVASGTRDHTTCALAKC